MQCCNKNNYMEKIEEVVIEKRKGYSAKELLNLLMEQVNMPKLICVKNEHMYSSNISELFKDLCVIFHYKKEMSTEEVLNKLPFLRKQLVSNIYIPFEPDGDFFHELLIDINILNGYVKEKQFSPKTSRWVYDMKTKLIKFLLKHTDMISEEWSECREDGEEFVSYRIECKNGDSLVFHQPFRNVKDLYKTTIQRNKVFLNTKKYHIQHLDCSELSLFKNDYYVLTHLVSLRLMLLGKYFINNNK